MKYSLLCKRTDNAKPNQCRVSSKSYSQQIDYFYAYQDTPKVFCFLRIKSGTSSASSSAQSMTKCLPYRWLLFNAFIALLASSLVEKSINAKPRCKPVLFLGIRMLVIRPKGENKSLTSLVVAWKARFFTINLNDVFAVGLVAGK